MSRSFIDKIIYLFFPSWLLNTTPWKDLWEQFERERSLRLHRSFMLLGGVGFLLHYFLVDGPLGLTKDPIWFYYRFGIFSLSLAIVALTFVGQSRHLIANLGFWIFSLITCWAQARSLVWYSGVSPLWPFIIASISTFCYRADLGVGLLMLTVIFALQSPSFIESNQNLSLSIGSAVVSYLFLVSTKKSRQEEILAFISAQRQIEVEKTLSEVQQNLADQVRAFLPGKINEDLKFYLRNGYSVTQAVDEVLRPKHKIIACLFSDIRGFTQKSKKLSYVGEIALPNIKSGTSIVEEYGGIPRLIGDLIFAYFEKEDQSTYLKNAYRAANQILKENILFNKDKPPEEKIIRYIIIDCGEAMCGNMGSSDASREITALGLPVNRCARLDELTKDPKIRSLLGDQAIVMSEAYVAALVANGFNGKFEKIILKDLALSVRDFPEEVQLYFTNQIQELRYESQASKAREVA